ncbi:YbhB/YbcL family Raf kinase inhibitor-like protein [Halosolutus halophilus]|uniref:YbhB/YbcL family Raf kinase inhibitor-like protein n=1 Tax=Halosolutus halophilus TaxID=1552990 RepID=UPI002235294C|nr:YbhB/YbcL family Raf kinase inhibitor-like protein [Halosolutus halophilus]
MIGALTSALDDADPLTVTSPDFEYGTRLPDWTGFTNENENPELRIDGVPDAAESLLVTMIHPEAAEVVDHPWIHWLAWGIDPDTEALPRNGITDDAIEGYNDFLRQGWGGPSPPPGRTETYRFRVYALDLDLDVPPETRRARIASTIGLEGAVLAAGELTGQYSAEQGSVFNTEGPSGLRP